MKILSFYYPQTLRLVLLTILTFGLTQKLLSQSLITTIKGTKAQDRSGHVCMPNATTVAIGARLNDDGGSNRGEVRIYHYKSGSWVLKGSAIYGEKDNDYSGETLSMPDENTIAIGAKDNDGNGTSSGHVRVYRYNGSAWIQKGGDIDGEAVSDKSSISISMPDNNTVAVGAYYNDGNGSNSGHVRIFAFNGTAWVQKGTDLNGSAANDNFGAAVDMPTSEIIAIGGPKNDSIDSDAGEVKVFNYISGKWVQKGSSIFGTSVGDRFGEALSMPDGITLAIGSMFHNSNQGQVRVYRWNGNAWEQKGSDIDGENTGDYSGCSVSMPNSNTLAIGAYNNSGVNGLSSGHVRIYSWNGSSWLQTGTDIDGKAPSDNSGRYISMPTPNTLAIGAIYNDDNGTSSGHIRIWDVTNKWTGTGNYTSTSNWSLGTVPIETDSVVIESGTITINQITTLDKINLFSGTAITLSDHLAVNSLYNGSNLGIKLNGSNLTLGNGITMNGIGGSNPVYLEGNSNSNLIIYDTDDHNVYFNNSKSNLASLQKKGSNGGNLTINNSISISDFLCVSDDGSLNCHNCTITLLSTSAKTAYVGESAGTITATGGFNVQQYIPGRRVFRFLAHPFKDPIALSQLTDDIDITGTGGTTNGFTATPKNNPSAFYFDPSAADNTSSGLNPGWTAWANTTPANWEVASPVLIYIRGAKGQGIDGKAYAPSAVTLDMSGSINTGTQTITLTKGANSTFVTVGNPYPSPIQMQSITSAKRSNVSSNYWVFDANLGANGGYVSKLWDTDSYVLPAYAGFATELSADGSITFEEAHKTTSSPANIFLGGNHLSDLVLNVFVNDRLYDLTRLITHDQAQSNKDYFDGGKMENADINFFTLSKNGEQLSIDARPFDFNTERIAMGLFSSKDRTIKIQADPSAFLNEHSVTLIDHYTNKQYNLNEGESAELSIDLNQSKSYGTERLELVIGQLQSHTEKLNQAQVHVYPNPSQSSNAIYVQANSPIQHIAVMDVSGRLVWETSPENKSEFMEIPETALANAGIYFIEITTALGMSSQKHVVQN